MKDLEGKLGEDEITLTKATSIVSTHDKELANLKEIVKTCEQVFYNIGFKDVKSSMSAVVFQARRFEFSEGWMTYVNAIDLPESSTFKDTNQIPSPDDRPVKATIQEQPDDGGDEVV